MLKEILEKEVGSKVEWTDGSQAKGIYNGIEFRLLMSGRGRYKSIGDSSHPFDGIEMSNGKVKIYKEYNDDIMEIVNKANVAALNFRQGRNAGIGFPVIINKAADYFDSEYDRVMDEEVLLKISSYIGHKQAYKNLEKVIPDIFNLFSKKVDGAFFFNKELQKTFKGEVKDILVANGLKITAETKSVIEFEGSVLFTEFLDEILETLDNGSYYE